MTRPVNPQDFTQPNVGAGTIATPASANQLLDAAAHVAGRRTPLLALAPVTRAVDSVNVVDVDGWDVPILPTHGHWLEVPEKNPDPDAPVAYALGPAQDQFGDAASVWLTSHAIIPSGAPVSVASRAGVSIDDLGNSPTTDTEDGTHTHRDALADLLLDPAWPVPVMSRMYGDVGAYNFSSRDLYPITLGMIALGTSVRPTRYQAQLAGEVGGRTWPHSAWSVGLDAPGSTPGTMRQHIGALTVHATTSDSADTVASGSTGWDVIPQTVKFSARFGGSIPTSSTIGTENTRDLVHAARTAYASRGRCITSLMRDPDRSATGPLRPYANGDKGTWRGLRYGVRYTVPPALPGSENATGASSGTTIATRGGLVCRVLASAARVRFGIRKINSPATFGTWAFAEVSASSWQWYDADDVTDPGSGVLLLPAGTEPGYSLELAVWWCAADNDGGFLGGFAVWEPPLSRVD